MKTNEIFMFASLISAVDPVATLGAFSALGVEPKLNALVYGESILNDAVAIAAFRVFDSMDGAGFSLADALLSVIWLLTGSFGVGVGSGVVAALFFKCFGRRSKMFGAKHDAVETRYDPATGTFVEKPKDKQDNEDTAHDGHSSDAGKHSGEHSGDETEHAMVEAAMFFFASMASFFLAECFHLSGIISSLFAGMVCNNYAWHNLTPLAQELSKHFYEQMMVIMEQLTCLWVGVVFVFSIADGHISWSFTVIGLITVVVSRGVTVFPLGAAVNAALRWQDRPLAAQVPQKHMQMMFVAGLRGAIALVLVVGMPMVGAPDANVRRNYFVSTCVFIIIFTNVVLGGMTVPMVKKLEIPNKLQGTLPEDIVEAVNLNAEELLHVRAFQAMDRKLFAPLLRIDVPDREAAAATLQRINAAKEASHRVAERVTNAIPASLRLRGGTGMEPASVVPTPANMYRPHRSLCAPSLCFSLGATLCVFALHAFVRSRYRYLKRSTWTAAAPCHSRSLNCGGRTDSELPLVTSTRLCSV